MKYEILLGPKGSTHWTPCALGMGVNKGWLRFELADGRTGLSAPGKWREVQIKSTDEVMS